MPGSNSAVRLEGEHELYKEEVLSAFEQQLYNQADRWNLDLDNYVEQYGPITVNVQDDRVGAEAGDGHVDLSGPRYARTVIPIADDPFAEKVVQDHPVPTHEVIKEAGHELRRIVDDSEISTSVKGMAANNLFGYGALAEEGLHEGLDYTGFEEEIFMDNLDTIAGYFDDSSRNRFIEEIDDYIEAIDDLIQAAETDFLETRTMDVRNQLVPDKNDEEFYRIHNVPMNLEESVVSSFVLPLGSNQEEIKDDLKESKSMLKTIRNEENYDDFVDRLQAYQSMYDAGHLVANRTAKEIANNVIDAEFSKLLQLDNEEIEELLNQDFERHLDQIGEEHNLIVPDIQIT